MPDPISWSATLPYFLMALVFGYLLGSIPFGLIITKLGGKGDVRKIGSGNIGATNVLRTGSKKLAAATLACDLLKGTAAVLAGQAFGPDTAVIAGFGAFVGHCFPVWLRFRGGKGVATYIGILLGFTWKFALLFGGVWLATALITRYSSASALVASLVLCIALYLTGLAQLFELFVALSALLWWRHRGNISRLIKGKESKIGN